jgi:hypothetical protein
MDYPALKRAAHQTFGRPSGSPRCRAQCSGHPEAGRLDKGVSAKPCEPEHGHAERDHGEVVGRPLLLAGSDAAVLLEPTDQPLDLVALAVCGLVEARLAGLILAGRDHRLDPPLPQPAPGRRAGVAAIACCPARAQTRAAAPLPRHCALVHQRVQGQLLVTLAGRQNSRDRFAAVLGAQMQPSRSSWTWIRWMPDEWPSGHSWSRSRPGCARAPRRRLRPCPHPLMTPDRRAPAACWRARTTVASTKCRSQSSSPRASAWAWSRCSTRSNTPTLRQQ